jgi:hypothetical protein
LARAKNTSRAVSRRRARVETRSATRALQAHDGAVTEASTVEDGATVSDEQPARRGGFRLPNFRQDVRDLPQILTSRRAMVLAPAMLLLGFALQMANSTGALPTEYGIPIPLLGWASFAEMGDLYVQMFFLPPALLTFFLAGYIAPRASYLVGALMGLLSGALWSIILLTTPLPADSPLAGETNSVTLVPYIFLLNVGYGSFAAAFAAWYRDFLRRMRDQGTARRTEREARERAKRREQRQADRRTLKTR